jgi:hypothetical protein
MSNVIDLNAFRKDRDEWDRLCDEESVDVFLAAFWHQSPFAELLDSPNLRRRTAQALVELRDYLRDSDERRPA